MVRSRFSSLENQRPEAPESRGRADMIIARPTQANAALVARMPELEAAECYENGSEGATETQAVPITRLAHCTDELRSSGKPWWRRLFDG